MPEEYKQSILAAFSAFPNVSQSRVFRAHHRCFAQVTFIWKYENPAHRVSEGHDNVIEATWVPQRDMLC